MISARIERAAPVLLLGPVRGLAQEADRVVESLETFSPRAVGLGLSPEEMRGLVEFFVDAAAEPVVPLTGPETSEVRGLVRFGEVRVPNPSFVGALRWARVRRIATEPLDPSDERSATLFTEHIGYVELVRRTVAERRVGRNPPAPSTADEFALTWDREIAKGRGSQAFARARDRHFVRAASRLALEGDRTALVVDRERFASVRSLLEGGVPSEMADV